MKKLLRPDEVADHLRVSTRTVYRMIDEGAFVVIPVRRALRITAESLERYQQQAVERFEIQRGFLFRDKSDR